MKCPICKESYDQGSRKSSRLSCGHHICQNCRDGSTNRRWKCCYCKNLINLDEPGKSSKKANTNFKTKKGSEKSVVEHFRSIDELECHDCYQNFFEQEMKYCKKCSGELKLSICEKCAAKNHKSHEVEDIFPSIEFERERMVREFLSPFGIKVLKCFKDMITAAENPSSFNENELKDIIENFKLFLKSANIVKKSSDGMVEDYKKGQLSTEKKRIVEFLFGKMKCSKCGTMEDEERSYECLTCEKISVCFECKNSHLSKGHKVESPDIYMTNIKEDKDRKDLGIFHHVIYPIRKTKVGHVPGKYRIFLDNEWRLDRMAQVARIYMIYAANRAHVDMFKACFYSKVSTCHECQIVHRKQDMSVCEKCIDYQLQSDPSTLITYDLSKMALCKQCSKKKHNSSGHQTYEFIAVEANQNATYFHDENGFKDKKVTCFEDIALLIPKINKHRILDIDREFVRRESSKFLENAKCSMCDNEDRRGTLQLCENCVNKSLSKTPECLMTLNLDNYALCKKCVFKSHSGHRLHSYEVVGGSKMGATHLSNFLPKMKTVPLRKFTDIIDYPEETQATAEFKELMEEMASKFRNM